LLKFFKRTLTGEYLNAGAYMWAVQRITGLILLGFFILHLTTLSVIFRGAQGFDQTMALMRHPIIKSLELLLIGIVVFHALNGVRLILLNFFIDLNQKILSYCFSLVTILCVIISIPFLW